MLSKTVETSELSTTQWQGCSGNFVKNTHSCKITFFFEWKKRLKNWWVCNYSATRVILEIFENTHTFGNSWWFLFEFWERSKKRAREDQFGPSSILSENLQQKTSKYAFSRFGFFWPSIFKFTCKNWIFSFENWGWKTISIWHTFHVKIYFQSKTGNGFSLQQSDFKSKLLCAKIEKPFTWWSR